MIALLLAPIYIALNVLVGFHLNKWLDVVISEYNKNVNKKVALGIYAMFASSILIGFLLPEGIVKRVFVLFGDYFLGVLLYTIIALFICLILYFLALKIKKFDNRKVKSKKTYYYMGLISVLVIIFVTVAGVINARVIRTTTYNVKVDKESSLDSLKIVEVADLHMGYNIGVNQISNMVSKINEEDPDVVFIAGDIFDNDYEALEYPDSIVNILKGIKSKYGVYAIWGNHDVDEKVLAGFSFHGISSVTYDIRMNKLLEDANITLLEDEGTYITDNIYVYGRPDYYIKNHITTKRKSVTKIAENFKSDDVVIVLDHQPRELNELSMAGVDLDLSGHTHDGQVWPANYVSKLFYKNTYGLKKFNNMTSIVTSGVGIFGPNMRVGTKAEIAVINLTFNNNKEM